VSAQSSTRDRNVDDRNAGQAIDGDESFEP
jgi:hypothetical protein